MVCVKQTFGNNGEMIKTVLNLLKIYKTFNFIIDLICECPTYFK